MFLIFALAEMANATTYTVDLPIVTAEPTLPTGSPTVTWEFTQEWLDVAPTAPDQSQTSSWSYITCILKDGDLTVKFSANSGSWPTSWPSYATCTSGTDTLQVNLISGALEDALVRSWTFDPLVGIVIETEAVFSGTFMYALPASGYYDDGVRPAKLSSTTNWPGVTCQVVWVDGDAAKPYLYIDLTGGSHTADSGQCVVPRWGGGSPYHIALTINHNTY